MEEHILKNKIDLFIKNYNQLKKIKGSWQMGMIQQSCALSLTIKNRTINTNLVEECLDIIKNNTGTFSNFRGYSLFYIATILSFEISPESSFKRILEIYEKLKKEKFYSDLYLPFVATIIYENKDKIDIDDCISKMKYVYQSMKSKHPFLTSSDDYSKIALIAIHSNDIDKDLEYIETCYEFFNKNGFMKGNDLQALSHIMCFSKDKSTEICEKVIKLRNLFNKSDCKMYGYGNPLIGAISLFDYNNEDMVKQVKYTSDYLKEIKGFGNFSLGKSNRNMISTTLVASSYSDYLKEENNLDSISNNILLNIIIAIEIACIVAIISVASVSASS